MNKKLIMLPESYPVTSRLIDYLFSSEKGGFDLLILEKQRAGLKELIASYAFGDITILDEEYYGGVTDEETMKFIESRTSDPYDTVFFPFNNFPANAYLFGSIIGREVIAVNSSLYGKRPDRELPRISFSLTGRESLPARVPWANDMGTINGAYKRIVEQLRANKFDFDITGERPSVGIIDGFAYDIERFCGYAFASSYVKGKRVLDIGGGLGFGSFLLSSFAETVTFFDRCADTVAFVNNLWKPLKDNIRAVSGDATMALNGSDMTAGSFDVVVMMDVIEHFNSPEAVLKSIRSLLADDGLLILSTPEPDLAPYTVCPQTRWGDKEEELIKDAIWPWHLHSLGEEDCEALLSNSGFVVVEKNYSTYVEGYNLRDRLSIALEDKDKEALDQALGGITDWKVSDFAITDTRDPYFSNYSYNIVAKKG